MDGYYAMHSLHSKEIVPASAMVVPMPPPAQEIATMPQEYHMELAQAYVRPQPLENIFSPEEGLRNGTAFPNLWQPYKGRGKPC